MIQSTHKNQSSIKKYIPNKIHLSKIFRLYIISNLFLITNSQLEINLIIEGQGEQRLLNDSFYKEPAEVIVNGVTKSSCKKICELEKELNNVTIKFNSLIESCAFMFDGLTNIIEVDLRNLDTSKVDSMQNMFHDCTKLEKINFGKINTSSVTNMKSLFHNCEKLKSIDVSNFNTESVINMRAMFSHCISLVSLDLSNFDTKNAVDLYDQFSNCRNLMFMNLSNFYTPKVKNVQGLFYQCYNLRYLDLSNFVGNSIETVRSIVRYCSSLVFIKLDSFTIKRNTVLLFVFDNTFDNLKICIKDSQTRNILNKYTTKFNCDHICFKENIKIDLKDNKCVQYCNESEYKFEYKKFCYEKCPDKTYPINNEFLCLDQKPEGYYLDYNSSSYKKCYETCKNCSKGGDEIYNNCIECKSQYIHLNGSKYSFLYELNIDNYKNCYLKCPYYFYLDKNTNKYYCTKNLSCIENYDKLIYEKNECVNKCEKDINYKYEFRKRCYEGCPEGSVKIENNPLISKYFCKPLCPQETPFVYISTQECVKNCPIKDMKLNTCIQNNEKNVGDNNTTQENNKEINEEDTRAQDILLQNLEVGFTSEDYDTTNLEKGEDEIFEDEKMSVTLTTTHNQKKNINNNMTIIDLGECELLLRQEYNISNNEPLFMKKIDVFQEGMKIPRVEYNVYSKLKGSNLERLNLSICQSSKIILSIPVIISESIDKLNSSSGYYNDICYIAKSEKGTDIILKDRKKEFIENNKTVCQDDCDFKEYDYTNNKAKCSCKVKEAKTSLADMKINKTKLYEKFVDINNIANIKLMNCYKVLFNKEGIIDNISFFIVIPNLIFHVVSMIIFYTKEKSIINDKIKEITFGINNWKLVKEEEKEKKRKEKRKRFTKKKKTDSNKNKEENKIKLNKEEDKKEIKENKLLSPIDFYHLNNILNKNNPPKKTKRKIEGHSNININKKMNDSKKVKNEDNSSKRIITENIDTNKQEIIKKAKQIMEYNNEEKNNLSYEMALKQDKRTFTEYYLSLLKSKNILLFSFFNNGDYNSRIIKIDLFFINFIIYLAINALFFNDNTMHKIYEDEGSFNFIYQLPQIIYSSLISAALNILLKIIALSEGDIIKFKQNKDKETLDKRVTELNDKLNIKFILYFIVGFVFELFLGYYISMFCAVYRNTQIHLIKDTLISFGMSLIYPFFIYLIPGFLRIISLSNPKNKRKYLYQLSSLTQMI